MQSTLAGQRVAPSMGAVSHAAGPSFAAYGHLRDPSVQRRSVASRAPPQHYNPIQRMGQSVQRHLMQINSLSGSSAQAQAGTKAADSQQLPQLPALDGKEST